MADRLAAEEREVSKRRRLLHGEMDIVRAEMVRRLRDKHSVGRVAGRERRCGRAHRHPQRQDRREAAETHDEVSDRYDR